MVCEAHGELHNEIKEIKAQNNKQSEDLAVIKSYLIGNGREGLLKKIDRHERYWNMLAGSSAFIGFTLAVVRILK